MSPNANSTDRVRRTHLLERARGRVLPAMAEAFSAALGRFDDALFDRAEQRIGQAQVDFLDGMRELRRQRAPATARFGQHLARAWEALERGQPLSVERALTDPTATVLSLVSETELESRLAARNVASVIARDFCAVLHRLDQRMGMLAGTALDADHNPVGSEHVGAALHEAFSDCDLTLEVRLVVIKLCERELVPQLGPIYDDLDQRLAQSGVISNLAPTQWFARSPARFGGESAAEGMVAGDGPLAGWAARLAERVGHRFDAGLEAPPELSGFGDVPARGAEGGVHGVLIEALHHLLQESRGQPAQPGMDGNQHQLSQQEMLSVLSLLQAAPSASLQHAAGGVSSESLAERLKSEVLGRVSQLGMDPANARLSPMDEDAIDLVGMLFDVMLDERDLETRSRELIGRLVVPFVKVALLDRRMFVQKTHPARRLLNVLAEACEGNSGQSQAERALMSKVEEVVDRLVAEFNENLAIFMTLEEEFRDFLAQHRRRIEIAERRAAEQQRGQEKLENARTRTATELSIRLGGRRLPRALEDFLRQPWAHHLTMALLREGEQGQGVAEALALADGLLQELAEAQMQVVGKPWLQAWRPALLKVFASVGLGAAAAATAIDALHDTLQAVAVARPDLERALPELPPTPVPPAAAAEPSGRIELVGGTDTLDFDRADADYFRALPVGAWLDFIDKDNKVQPGKLSWVSPISARLLFVNRRGVRFCVASPEELAVMVRLGRLRGHRAEDAFDSAMQGVIDRLGGEARQSAEA
ncbi:MAG: DUF1631 domain-containing protein [Pseudoxanthomonas sp.]